MANDLDSADWLAVIGRALAFLCLGQADLRDKKISEQARFLEGLGIPRKDVASMLGTTSASVTELLRLAKKGRTRGKKRKGS